MKRKTKSMILALGLIAFFGLAAITPVRAELSAAADIAAIPWSESNIAVLRSAARADVAKVVNQTICGGEKPCGVNIDQFAWSDLQGHGRYTLVSAWNFGGKVQTVSIFQQNSSGRIEKQSIDLEGYAHEGDLTNAIRDLKGDGKKELIINSGFGEGPDMAATPLTQWPMVYQLQDGQYVEASREFPGFYDKEVLPPLEEKISVLKQKVDSEVEAKTSGEALMKEYHWIKADIENHTSSQEAKAIQDSEHLALLQSLRNHILLVLGRRLTAQEEEEPRDWLKSSNGRLVWDAELAFEDMGGHDAEVREAEQALSRMTADFGKAADEEQKTTPAVVRPTVHP